jgi:hypothetical protein
MSKRHLPNERASDKGFFKSDKPAVLNTNKLRKNPNSVKDDDSYYPGDSSEWDEQPSYGLGKLEIDERQLIIQKLFELTQGFTKTYKEVKSHETLKHPPLSQLT